MRNALDRILQPLLAPIRRVVPLVGMFDLSPVIFNYIGRNPVICSDQFSLLLFEVTLWDQSVFSFT